MKSSFRAAIVRRARCAILLLATAGGGEAVGDVGYPQITLEEARALAQEAVKPQSFFMDYFAPAQWDPGFYAFEVVSSHPTASPHMGVLAVNVWTGDVWDMQGLSLGSCRRFASPILVQMQDDIRVRGNFRQRDYHELRAMTPSCLTD